MAKYKEKDLPINQKGNRFHQKRQNAQALEAITLSEIEAFLKQADHDEVPESVDRVQILNLLRNGLGGRPDQYFLKQDGTIDADSFHVFCRFYTILHTIRVSEPILTAEQAEAQDNLSRKAFEKAIADQKQAGSSYEDVIKTINAVTIGMAGTHHPTEHLSKEGCKLYRHLIAAAGNPKQAQKSIAQAIKAMIHHPCGIGTDHKNTPLDENESDDDYARTQDCASNDFIRLAESAIEKAYGRKPGLGELMPDTGRRTWSLDTDGKNNVEGWVWLNKMARTTLGRINETLETLAGINGTETVLKKFKILQDHLTPLVEESANIITKLATAKVEERPDIYKSLLETYKDNVKRFAGLYSHVGSQGNSRGFDMYMDTLDILKGLYKAQEDPQSETAIKIQNSYLNLKRNGMALEKLQIRQNDEINGEIIANLFTHPDFQKQAILSARDIKAFERARKKSGKSSKDRLKFETLQHDYCAKILAHVKENGNRRTIVENLRVANPLTFDRNGYPSQTYSALDCLELYDLYQLKFDYLILSDAKDFAPSRAHFLTELFGVTHSRIMPLFEDRETLSRFGDMILAFRGSVGDKRAGSRKVRQTISAWLDYYGDDVFTIILGIMRACSDSMKGGGIGTVYEGTESYRLAIRAMRDLNKTSQHALGLLIMLGTGLSSGRYGSNPGNVRRVVEQMVRDITLEEAKPLDIKDNKDWPMLKSALKVMYTQQGRAKRIFAATPQQILNYFCREMAGMLSGQLELRGLVKPFTIIPQTSAPSETLKKTMDKSVARSIERYEELRFLRSQHDPNICILDTLAGYITCPHTVSYTNNGARPESKNTSGTKKMTSGMRAIEDDQRKMLSGMCSCYGAGAVARQWYDHFKRGKISTSDIDIIINSPQMHHDFLKYAVIDAGRSKLARALVQTGWENATFDDVLTVGQSVNIYCDLLSHDHFMDFDSLGGQVTEEQAYLAKIFFDRLQFTAIIEAALARSLDRNLNDILHDFRPDDNSVDFEIGHMTAKKFQLSSFIIHNHNRNQDGMDIMHFVNDQIQKNGENIKQAFGGDNALRRSLSAYRAGTLPHLSMMIDPEDALFPHHQNSV